VLLAERLDTSTVILAVSRTSECGIRGYIASALVDAGFRNLVQYPYEEFNMDAKGIYEVIDRDRIVNAPAASIIPRQGVLERLLCREPRIRVLKMR
jgi:hypothetical protein